MRSRYTAYARGNTEWLKATWHPATHRGDLDVGQPVKWVRLEIVATKAGGPDDDRGEVEFIAHYKIQGRAHRLHERSCFQRRDGRWLYVDGDLSPVTSCDDRD
jgi:SEC-C motif domain protein